jgi:glycosyltransferase involved in cell wall biosynthesis
MVARLAAVVSHPIQYQAPLFRAVAATPGVEFEALFLSEHGLRPTFDVGFGRAVRFDVDLLDGYAHRFVRNVSPRPSVANPLGLVNPGVAAALAGGRYDAVWVHGYGHASSWLAYGAAAALRVPWMLRGESTLLYDTPPSRRLAKRALLTPLVRGAGALLFIGRKNRAFYESFGARPEQLFHAPYSVDNAFFAARAEAARASGAAAATRRAIGAADDDVVILFAGKLVERKRPHDLVAAVQSLGEAGRRVVVALVGEGEERGRLERAVAESGVRAHLAGFVNQTELGAWFAAADLFVLPSTHETWGLVVNEAMAAGLPVVVSDLVGCAADLVEGRGTGAVHRAADPGSLAEALRPLVLDAGRRREAADQARRVVADFDVSVTARGVVEGLRAIAGRKGRGACAES